MRRSLFFVIALALLGLAAFSFLRPDAGQPPREPNQRPNDWFWTQRAWPAKDIEPAALDRALAQAAALDAAGSRLRSSWIQAGPTNIGARVTDLAVHPTNPDLVYAAMASGGVFKTSDGGSSWVPVFDEQAVLPVGAIALDPQAPETVYAGTGEANAASLSFFGRGVFKSIDGGASWDHLGLEATRYIGRIVVDPTDSNRVYLAATGKLFGTNPERGVYRSLDAGASWERVHALTDSTSCIDLAIDPQNPQRLYAAMWERVRGLTYRRSGGPSSGIWRSEDGGDSWHELTSGLPGGSDVGRIGISVCAGQPEVIYAIYADASAYFDGVYKSTNGGDSWSAVNDGALSNIYSSYGWWFGNIRVDPADPDHVIALGLPAYRSTNGGASWSETGGSMHVDHHALAFAPSLPSRIYEGNDGGIYRSGNGGSSWSKLYDQPTSQFYAIGIDHLNPHRLYGGTQDNGTLRTWNGGTDDWDLIYGGDGFYTLVDPTNSNVIYAEYQYGGLGKSTNGGGSFSSATSGINSGDRRNWSTPVVMDPSDHETLYYGTYRVYRSTNAAGGWSAISSDLTGGNHGANFGTITTLAVAPADPAVLAAGTDDGRVWVSANGGGNWTRVDAALPERWVTRVAFDPADAALLYVTFSGLRWDEDPGHVFRSEDLGANWQDITGNLPAAPVNVILADPDLPGRVYAGTDVGVYSSQQPGGAWSSLATGLPRSPVLDLKLHAPTRKLVAGTHGRSMFALEIDALTSLPSPEASVGRLLPNHPNPFNPSTTLRFELAREARVRLSVHDAAGRELALLLDESRGAGEHALQWRPVDLASGVYFARFSSEGFTDTRKLVLIR
jgi:photosystem II stability/assembly factor-like uncharacterized protein